jgi:cytochrome c oxidase subunit II
VAEFVGPSAPTAELKSNERPPFALRQFGPMWEAFFCAQPGYPRARVTSRRLFSPGVIVGCALVAAGCGSKQDILRPESHPARQIDHLWWIMLTGAWIGFAVIAFLLLLGWVRRNRSHLPFGGGDRAATGLVIGLGVAVPILVLTILFVYADIFVIRSTAAPKPSSTSMTIQVVGHDWFWEVRYPGTAAVTANEIHIPVGTRVDLVGTTADVIHSFWVPALNRKIDLIPGRENRILLEADRPGVYRGQCAEFCGLQHAHMSLYVFAEPKAKFDAWLANMARPAPAPRGAEARRGEQVFLSEPCAACHQIRGTSARGQIGPDLTHLATRTTLAALAIPNTRSDLSDWIADPQHAKPGNRMPALALKPDELKALVAYLDGLR